MGFLCCFQFMNKTVSYTKNFEQQFTLNVYVTGTHRAQLTIFVWMKILLKWDLCFVKGLLPEIWFPFFLDLNSIGWSKEKKIDNKLHKNMTFTRLIWSYSFADDIMHSIRLQFFYSHNSDVRDMKSEKIDLCTSNFHMKLKVNIWMKLDSYAEV